MQHPTQPTCIVYSHETLDDSKRVATYTSLDPMEKMLAAMPMGSPAKTAVSSGESLSPYGHLSSMLSPSNPGTIPGSSGSIGPLHPIPSASTGRGSTPTLTPFDGTYGNTNTSVSSFNPNHFLMPTLAVGAPGPEGLTASGGGHHLADNPASAGFFYGYVGERRASAGARTGANTNTTNSSTFALSGPVPAPPAAIYYTGQDGGDGDVPVHGGRSSDRHFNVVAGPTPAPVDHNPAMPRIAAHCSPLALRLGGALSAMSAAADFSDGFTRCHCIDGIEAAAVSSLWYTAALLAAECALEAHPGFAPRPLWPQSHRASCVDGAFVLRAGLDRFTIGLVTSCSAADPRLPQVIAEFTRLLNRAVTGAGVPLPIGAGLRQCSVRLWFTPRYERVVPYGRLPPVKVILEDDRLPFLESGAMQRSGWPVPARALAEASPEGTTATANTNTATAAGTASTIGPVVFKGYNDMRMYVFRPTHSLLRGAAVVAVPHQLGVRRLDPHMPAPARVNLVSSPVRARFHASLNASTGGSSGFFGASGSGGGGINCSSMNSSDTAARTTRFRHNPYDNACLTPSASELSDGHGGGGGTLAYSSRNGTPAASTLQQQQQGYAEGGCHSAGVMADTAAAALGPSPDSMVAEDEWVLNGLAHWQTHAASASHPTRSDDGGHRHGATPGQLGTRTVARVHLFFTGLCVTGTGEHLLAFESTVEDNYRPFLPVLSAHLSPFLVVDPEDDDEVLDTA